ncbi:MAG: hypothetical protein FD143_3550 [Ignavibacteria bacterium]|nr:MAG: hypothetical protein FD143_3550 [Ignavibacteria bacterium]
MHFDNVLGWAMYLDGQCIEMGNVFRRRLIMIGWSFSTTCILIGERTTSIYGNRPKKTQLSIRR